MSLVLNIIEPRKKKLLRYFFSIDVFLIIIWIIMSQMGLLSTNIYFILMGICFSSPAMFIGINYYIKPFRLNGNLILLNINSVTLISEKERTDYKASEIEIHIDSHEDVGHPLIHTANYGGKNFVKMPDGTQHHFYLKRQSDLFRVKNYIAKSCFEINLI